MTDDRFFLALAACLLAAGLVLRFAVGLHWPGGRFAVGFLVACGASMATSTGLRMHRRRTARRRN